MARAPLRPYGAESMSPVGGDKSSAEALGRQLAGRNLAVYELPTGFLATEDLAAALTSRGHDLLWLRLGAEDADPGGFLVSLAKAADRHRPGCGGPAIALLRRRPGPVYGWPPLFDRLAGTVGDALAGHGVVVLDHVDMLRGPGGTLSMLTGRLLPELRARGVPGVLLAGLGSQLPALPADTARWRAGDLEHPAGPADARRPRRCRGAAAHLALRAARAVAPDAAQEILDRSTGLDDLLSGVARTLLPTFDEAQRRRLGMAIELEYGRGDPAGPWWQSLEGGWFRLRSVWRAPLAAALALRDLPDPQDLRKAGDQLMRTGVAERAIALYLAAGDDEAAATAAAAHADDLMNLGRWQTLDGWIGRLPDGVLREHPMLLHDRGEIAAGRGDVATAQRWFDLAARRFVDRGDRRGACRSMMAASTVAAAADDLDTARSRSAAAAAFAQAGEDVDCLVWSAWAQAGVALLDGDQETALLGFARAAQASHSGAVPELIRSADAVSRQINDLRCRQEHHRTAITGLQERESELLVRLLNAVTAGPGGPGLPGPGWSGAPIPLRLRGLDIAPNDATATGRGLTARLRRLLGGGRRPGPSQGPGPTVNSADQPGPALTAELMGPFKAAVDAVAVEERMETRIRSLLAYLVTHREPWPTGEALAEALRPGSTREAGRNSLNVAMHGLRRILREVTPAPVVIFTGAVYRLHPAVELWTDVDYFEDVVARGRRQERAGKLEAAVAAYEDAIGLCRGELLADEPYEEWPADLRERLRMSRLDTLGRLAGLHFDAGRYGRAADVAGRLVEQDPCREQAHRLLMRCHSRRDLPHLALLQFRTCVRILGSELKVEPSPETVRLYRAIRRHEPV